MRAARLLLSTDQRSRASPLLVGLHGAARMLAARSENVAPGSSGMSEPPAKQPRLAPEAAEPAFRVQRVSDKATLPKRGSAKAAGYDLARCGGGGSAGGRAIWRRFSSV
jgi:hypothetical protein